MGINPVGGGSVTPSGDGNQGNISAQAMMQDQANFLNGASSTEFGSQAAEGASFVLSDVNSAHSTLGRTLGLSNLGFQTFSTPQDLGAAIGQDSQLLSGNISSKNANLYVKSMVNNAQKLSTQGTITPGATVLASGMAATVISSAPGDFTPDQVTQANSLLQNIQQANVQSNPNKKEIFTNLTMESTYQLAQLFPEKYSL